MLTYVVDHPSPAPGNDTVSAPAAAEMSREQQDLLAAAVTKPGEYALKSGSTNVNMEIMNI